MHRMRSLRSRVERLIMLLGSVWVAWAVSGAVWFAGRWLSYFVFSGTGAILLLIRGYIRDRARVVRQSSARARTWVLPVRDGGIDQPDDQDSGGAAPGGRLGPPGNGDQRGLER